MRKFLVARPSRAVRRIPAKIRQLQPLEASRDAESDAFLAEYLGNHGFDSSDLSKTGDFGEWPDDFDDGQNLNDMWHAPPEQDGQGVKSSTEGSSNVDPFAVFDIDQNKPKVQAPPQNIWRLGSKKPSMQPAITKSAIWKPQVDGASKTNATPLKTNSQNGFRILFFMSKEEAESYLTRQRRENLQRKGYHAEIPTKEEIVEIEKSIKVSEDEGKASLDHQRRENLRRKKGSYYIKILKIEEIEEMEKPATPDTATDSTPPIPSSEASQAEEKIGTHSPDPSTDATPPRPSCEPPPTETHSPEPSTGATPHSSSVKAFPSISFPTPRQRALLPLSPLMAPSNIFWSTLHEPKQRPSDTPTPFQQKLSRNPYARILASPVRMCGLTRAQLPRALLQSFELLVHPTSGEPWYLPRDLSSPVPRSQLSEGETNKRIRLNPRQYVLARKDLLEGFVTGQSGFAGQWTALVHRNLKHEKEIEMNQIRWRSDMQDFVLKLLRKRIVEELVNIFKRERGHLAYANDWNTVVKIKQMGAILWVGSPQAAGPSVSDSEGNEQKPLEKGNEETKTRQNTNPAAIDADGPGFFATVSNPPFWTEKRPLHNLVKLLGQEEIDNLRAQIPSIARTEFTVLKNKPKALKVQLMLWKLQGYLAPFEDAEEQETEDASDKHHGDDDSELEAEDNWNQNQSDEGTVSWRPV